LDGIIKSSRNRDVRFFNGFGGFKVSDVNKENREKFRIVFRVIISKTMDYSEDFRLVQTTLNHCNEFVKKFDKIVFYGGKKTKKSFIE
jgi:hypothetical protein